MPPSPTTSKQFDVHKYKKYYLVARHDEWTKLLSRNTFKEVDIPPGIKPILVKWVDLEKYDKDGFLYKFRSRLVVRGDLQHSSLQSNYAATLAARVFRFIMALVAIYNLDAEQLDAINAFINSDVKGIIISISLKVIKENEDVYC
jgi:hypothetical protein